MRVKSTASRPCRILGAVDEAHHAAQIEVAKTVHFVDDRDRRTEPSCQLRGELEAEIHLIRADVQQDIARRTHGAAFALRRIRGTDAGSPGAGRRTSVSHTSEPKPTTHDRLPEGTRLPTERTRAATSPHHARTCSAGSWPRARVATMKIALRVMSLQTACDSGVSLGIGLNIDEPLLIPGMERMSFRLRDHLSKARANFSFG